MTTGEGVLLQYGAVGVFALLLAYAVKVMFDRLHAAFLREQARADRLEEELAKLNEAIRTEYAATIARAGLAISEANRAVTDAMAAFRRLP